MARPARWRVNLEVAAGLGIPIAYAGLFAALLVKADDERWLTSALGYVAGATWGLVLVLVVAGPLRGIVSGRVAGPPGAPLGVAFVGLVASFSVALSAQVGLDSDWGLLAALILVAFGIVGLMVAVFIPLRPR